MLKPFVMMAAGLAIGGCATADGGGTGSLDRLFADRCSEAQMTIARLRDTADLYEATDLADRMRRAHRLSEIWCPSVGSGPPELTGRAHAADGSATGR